MPFLTSDWPRLSYALDGSHLRSNRSFSGYHAAPAWQVISGLAAIPHAEKYPLFILISLARYRNERARRLHKITWQELKSSTGISRNNHPKKRSMYSSCDRAFRTGRLDKRICEERLLTLNLWKIRSEA